MIENKKLLITGGAGFIGSAVIRHIINNTNHSVINVDKLTYAGNLESLASIENNTRYTFECNPPNKPLYLNGFVCHCCAIIRNNILSLYLHFKQGRAVASLKLNNYL